MKRVLMILSVCLLSAFLVLGIAPTVSPASRAYAATGSVEFTYFDIGGVLAVIPNQGFDNPAPNACIQTSPSSDTAETDVDNMTNSPINVYASADCSGGESKFIQPTNDKSVSVPFAVHSFKAEH